MRHDLLRKYLTNPRDFDGWLKANVFVGSIVAVAILMMALAALQFYEALDQGQKVRFAAMR
jgi:hypothetical protein